MLATAGLLGCADDATDTPAASSSGTTGGEAATSSSDGGVADTGDTTAATLDGTDSGGSDGSGSSDESSGDSTGEGSVCPPVPYTALRGDTYGGLSGWVVTMAGDFDGDGIGDYALSTPRADGMLTTDSGRVHVVRGGQGYDDIDLGEVGDMVQGWVIEGEQSNHRAGDQLSAAYDVDGDGFDDLLLSSTVAPLGAAPEEQGRWSVVGGREFTSTVEPILLADIALGDGGFAIDGRSSAPFPGFPVSGIGVGDLNGDELADILLGVPFAGGLAGPSMADVLFGRDDAPGTILIGDGGPPAGEGFEFFTDFGFTGFVVGAGGDINGDDVPDFLVGANPDGEVIVYAVFGGEDVDTRTLDDLAMGIGGFAIDVDIVDPLVGDPGVFAILGDIDGDGMDDIGFSVSQPLPEDGQPAGIGVVWGKADTDRVSLEATFAGTGGFVSTRAAGDTNRLLGQDIGGAGDINGDGFADFYVVAGADPQTALGGDDLRGKVYVAYGGDGIDAVDLTAVDEETAGFVFESPVVNDDFGHSIDGGADVNGDGIPDLVIGAPQDGPFGTVYVVYGFNEACPRVR
ncbi:MAG: integrin alpha [Myxococcota bacterium]